MTLAHSTRVYAVKSCKIAKLLTDPPGGPATYGTSVVLPGVKKLVKGGAVNTKQLRGDNRLLATDSVLDSYSAAIDHAKLSLDVLAILFSTAVVDSGVTPNQLASWAHLATDTLGWFRLQAIAQSVEVSLAGDLLVTLWKVKLSGIPTMGLNEEDFQLYSQPLLVAPRDADGAVWDEVIRETSVALT